MIPFDWLSEAQQRIGPHIRQTPLTYDAEFDLYLKWENQQVTGSFKARGAFNKVLSLERWEQQAGLLAASAGNHGQGVALAGRLVGAPVTVFVSENAVPAKVEAMRALGAEIRPVAGGYGQAEMAALAFARQSQATWISPYNDGQVIAGQGTLGLEICQQLAAHPKFQRENAVWLVPASGGGLLAGIAIALGRCSPRPKLIGAQSDTSPFLHGLFYCGTQEGLLERPSVADGLAGPVEPGAITIPIVRQLVDQFLLVTEEQTRQAIAWAWQRYGERIEGAAAVGLAAILSGKMCQRPAVLVISGGNIQPEVHDEILRAYV